jgi:hypothetical protein
MAMSKEEYQQWVDHPGTKQFHQYLKDYRLALMEKWAQGSLPPDSPESLMAVARCQMADEIATLDDDSVDDFYRKEGAK